MLLLAIINLFSFSHYSYLISSEVIINSLTVQHVRIIVFTIRRYQILSIRSVQQKWHCSCHDWWWYLLSECLSLYRLSMWSCQIQQRRASQTLSFCMSQRSQSITMTLYNNDRRKRSSAKNNLETRMNFSSYQEFLQYWEVNCEQAHQQKNYDDSKKITCWISHMMTRLQIRRWHMTLSRWSPELQEAYQWIWRIIQELNSIYCSIYHCSIFCQIHDQILCWIFS